MPIYEVKKQIVFRGTVYRPGVIIEVQPGVEFPLEHATLLEEHDMRVAPKVDNTPPPKRKKGAGAAAKKE